MASKDDFQKTLTAATRELSDALEKALAMFPEWQEPQARVALANYALGYLGVSFGLRYGQ